MTRIDRYLLTLYFRILFICLASITSLFIVIHYFSNMDGFERLADKGSASPWSVAVSYYKPFALTIFEQLSALMALLALLFTVAWLNKTNELTALLAAGVTKRRIVRPLLIASLSILLGAALLRETAIPLFQDQLDRKPADLTGQLPRPLRPAFDPQTVCLIQGRHLLPVNKEIAEISIRVQGGPLLTTYGNKLAAKSGFYQEASELHPAGYLLSDVTVPRNIDARPSMVHPETGSPLLMTSKDHTWLKPGDCFLASSIEYETLRGGSSWQRYASTRELVTHLQAESTSYAGYELRVAIHQRVVRPAIDWTILLLGIPILLRRPDRHLFYIGGVSLAVVGGFFVLVMGLAAMGASGYLISPQLAAWLPLFLFTPWAWANTCRALES